MSDSAPTSTPRTVGPRCYSVGHLRDVRRWTGPGWVAVVLIATVFLSYSAVLSSTYGMLDDYYFLDNAQAGNSETIKLLVGAGRPLNAYILNSGFQFAGSLERLNLLRAITLLGLALLSYSLYLTARRSGVRHQTSLFLAAGFILLPSAQVYAGWTQHFSTPYAGVMALVAAAMITPRGGKNNHRPLLRLSAAIFLLTVSNLIYQPAAMFFCTGVLISVTSSLLNRMKWKRSDAFRAITVFGISNAFTFGCFKLGQHLFPSTGERSSLVTDYSGKVEWFIKEVLGNAFSLFAVPRNSSLAIVVLASVVGLLLLVARKMGPMVAALLALTLFLGLPLSYTPNLLIEENWASYRSSFAVTGAVWTFLVLTSASMITTFPSLIANRARVPACFLVVLLSLQASTNVRNGLILPNVVEIDNAVSLFVSSVSSANDNLTVVVRPSSWTDSHARPMAYDEFGMHSSLRDYYAMAIIRILLRSLPDSDRKIDVVLYSPDLAISSESRIVSLDFPSLVVSQRSKLLG